MRLHVHDAAGVDGYPLLPQETALLLEACPARQ